MVARLKHAGELRLSATMSEATLIRESLEGSAMELKGPLKERAEQGIAALDAWFELRPAARQETAAQVLACCWDVAVELEHEVKLQKGIDRGMIQLHQALIPLRRPLQQVLGSPGPGELDRAMAWANAIAKLAERGDVRVTLLSSQPLSNRPISHQLICRSNDDQPLPDMPQWLSPRRSGDQRRKQVIEGNELQMLPPDILGRLMAAVHATEEQERERGVKDRREEATEEGGWSRRLRKIFRQTPRR